MTTESSIPELPPRLRAVRESRFIRSPGRNADVTRMDAEIQVHTPDRDKWRHVAARDRDNSEP